MRHLAALEPLLGAAGAGAAGPAGTDATELMVYSRTRGATVSVDGAAPGPVPLVAPVKAGTHRIRVEAPGHFPEELEGAAAEGRLTVLEVTLRERPARLAVLAPEDAEVFVDGKPAGAAPLPAALELPPGRHSLTVTEPGAHPFVRQLELGRGEEAKVEAALETTAQRTAAGWLLAGAAALALGGGTTTGLALREQAAAEEVLARRDAEGLAPADLDVYGTAIGRRDELRVASLGLLGGAAALGLVGGALWLTDAAHEQVAPPPAPAPAVEPPPEAPPSSPDAS